MPPSAAVDGDEHRGLAFGAQCVGPRGKCRGVDAEIVHHRLVAERHRAPATVPLTPLPVTASKASAAASVDAALLAPFDDRLGERMLGALLEAGGKRRADLLVDAVSRDDIGRASACLRSACRSCRRSACRRLANRSSASASLISTPACAPRPVAVMIDIGVARPSAQGQAMISTETAETMAKTMRGSGPNERPDDEGGDGDQHDRRHEIGRDPVGEPLDRRARLRCALATISTICDEHRVGADLLGRHDQRAVAC